MTFNHTKLAYKKKLNKEYQDLQKKYEESKEDVKNMQDTYQVLANNGGTPPDLLKSYRRRVRYVTTVVSNMGHILSYYRKNISEWVRYKEN